MAEVTIGMLLVLFLPFVLSLAGKAATPKVICLVTSILSLLLSVEPQGAVLPWLIGMLISVMSVWETILQRRTASLPGSRQG